jgi:hypothetical protein
MWGTSRSAYQTPSARGRGARDEDDLFSDVFRSSASRSNKALLLKSLSRPTLKTDTRVVRDAFMVVDDVLDDNVLLTSDVASSSSLSHSHGSSSSSLYPSSPPPPPQRRSGRQRRQQHEAPASPPSADHRDSQHSVCSDVDQSPVPSPAAAAAAAPFLDRECGVMDVDSDGEAARGLQEVESDTPLMLPHIAARSSSSSIARGRTSMPASASASTGKKRKTPGPRFRAAASSKKKKNGRTGKPVRVLSVAGTVAGDECGVEMDAGDSEGTDAGDVAAVGGVVSDHTETPTDPTEHTQNAHPKQPESLAVFDFDAPEVESTAPATQARPTGRYGLCAIMCAYVAYVYVCVCVCVCARERER